MADVLAVHTADALLHTGAGSIAGLVISAPSGTATPKVTFYDNTEASGTKIFEAVANYPLIIFFSDPFAPRFVTGLYLDLEVGVSVTIWLRQL